MRKQRSKGVRAVENFGGVTEWEKNNLALHGPPDATSDDLEWDWNWPTPPRCAGTRSAMNFLPVVLREGDTFSFIVRETPFGLTVGK